MRGARDERAGERIEGGERERAREGEGGREEEQDTQREFAEFWLGEHTSGHYRSLST